MSRLRTSSFSSSPVKFVTEQYFSTLLLLFSGIALTYFTSKNISIGGFNIPALSKLIVPWLLLLLVTTQVVRAQVGLLFWVIIFLALNLVFNFYTAANHGFMITYIGVALMICIAAKEDGAERMQTAAVFLLSILMGLALIQKLSSPYYLSGNLIGEYILTGKIFKNLISLFYSEWPSIVHANLAAEKELLAQAMATPTPVSITAPPVIQLLIIALTYTALASQALLEVVVLTRHWLGKWAHYILLLFVLIIYSTRNENVFLSMNLILGYAMTDEETKSVRVFYVIGIVYLLTMQLTGIRPGIIG